MIDTDKYEGHTEGPWNWNRFRTYPNYIYHLQNAEKSKVISCDNWVVLNLSKANKQLIADAPLLLEFIEKVVEEWARPNACPKSFGKEVRSLLLEYGLINFNEETRRYEVKE
tara:strand:+ start:68 stop:403 length:336 start_codon:yes stop_codon:yes gene_type:complete